MAAPIPSKIDSIRERELYRYYQPPESPGAAVDAPSNPSEAYTNLAENTVTAHVCSSPDTTYTALAQLCACRLQTSRAMISLIDREKQYFIAESTKTLNLSDTTKSDAPNDGLWVGCATVDKSGRLCERTIELQSIQGHFPVFTVTDLSKDSRFNQLPFVTGPPNFRFYAGTPLTTNRGINIGSLFILDDKTRPPLTFEEESFLGTIAQTIIKHMEITSDAEERKKVMKLSMGLNAFVEGRSRLVPDNISNNISEVVQKRWSELDGNPRSPSQNRLAKLNGMSASNSSQEESEADATARNSLDTSHKMTFARAASILSESLDIQGRGGVVYFDSTSRRRNITDPSAATHSRGGSLGRMDLKKADVISAAVDQSANSLTVESKAFKPLDEELLHRLLERYPHGKLWSFDGDGCLSSSEEEDLSPNPRSLSARAEERRKRKQAEANALREQFPGVRQLIFAGLWDAGSSRWFTGGFAWTTSSRQIFSVETELNFFMSFGNSVMAQVSRLASVAADRQKADFIGSISHELRSPLHGILASAEFLSETDQDGFQSSLVDTISSCGRTLLDTINHILDYSKINSFERNWRNTKKPAAKSRHRRIAADKEAPPMLNIYAPTNVASITEEVVEGVYAGQIYQDIGSTEPTDFSAGRDHQKKSLSKEVEVILDIAHENYMFITQPGALKRVMMNVFGNALKYTQKGSIVVRISLDQAEDQTSNAELYLNERVLHIEVNDTGKGISREYLRTSLFSPFCQEDVLASGTGLGLSIVRSIVTMLQGTIDVQSEVGVGTSITIRIPLSRVPGAEAPISTPSSTVTEQSYENPMASLATDFAAATIAIHAISTNLNETQRVLRDCIKEWYGLHTIITDEEGAIDMADLVVVDERDLADYAQHKKFTVPTAVLCTNATRAQAISRQDSTIVEYISKPFGPRKLAKALSICLDLARSHSRGLAPQSSEAPGSLTPLATGKSDLLPEMEELTLETGDQSAPIEVQSNGDLSASYSHNAQMALDSSTNPSGSVTGDQDFPFPVATENDIEDTSFTDEKVRPLHHLVRQESCPRPGLVSRATEPFLKTLGTHISSAVTKEGERATLSVYPRPNDLAAAKKQLLEEDLPDSLTVANVALHNQGRSTTPDISTPLEKEKRPPRILLVDDNKINLRLLETYMKKRKYQFVDLAEDGQLAVNAAEAQAGGYDIIFMDISMPIMNGFEATRRIRDIEEKRLNKNENGTERIPALIIALTGLASSRDQTEAFTSGVDLFMTKPVSFKEVGRLLNNWETHGGLKSGESTGDGR